MNEERVERRLAAILAADIAGYSRLMGLDEEGTLRQLKAAMAGNLDAARNAMRQALQLDPNFRRITDRIPFRQPEVVARWEDVLRKAGLPE
jgi:class 3 adenylate cyclase